LITGPECTTTARERREGYRLALQDAGIAVNSALERSGPYTEDSALHLAGELLALDPPLEALFTANNRLTIGTLQAAYVRGLGIPEQIAVVGFDEVPGNYPGAFSVTTVIQPAYELGATAANRLIQHIEHPDDALPREFVLAHQLRVGDSSRSRVPVGAPIAG
jgi:LacI family transcriptional regulator